MAANLRKASSAIRKSFRTSKYAVFGTKDNLINEESESSPPKKWSSRRFSEATEVDEIEIQDQQGEDDVPTNKLKRSRSSVSVVTQSMREAVVNIRQKLRMSTRRQVSLKENSTPTRAAKRRQAFGGIKKVNRNVRMSSPFGIETPTRNKIKTCISLETPTRLRREVEDLTANMQALSALTPNTLKRRSSTRKSPPLTNGSLNTPRSARRRTVTDV